MLAVLENPSYWAFCWASGQVLARYILDHSSEFCGKTVLDLGSGSGVVGIAAKLAGASEVICCDIDPMALDATAVNAHANHVSVTLLDDLADMARRVDIAIAADVLYDRENMPLLERMPVISDQVIVADSRVKNVEIHGYELVDRQEATTIPDLDEFEEFRDVKVYRAVKAARSTPQD